MNDSRMKTNWLLGLAGGLLLGAVAGPAWAQCPTSPPAPISVTTGTLHDTTPIGPNLIAQTFTAPGAGCVQLDSIKVQVKKANQNPTVNLSLRLYQTTAGVPDLSNPIGAAIDLGTTTSSTYVDKDRQLQPQASAAGRDAVRLRAVRPDRFRQHRLQRAVGTGSGRLSLQRRRSLHQCSGHPFDLHCPGQSRPAHGDRVLVLPGTRRRMHVLPWILEEPRRGMAGRELESGIEQLHRGRAPLDPEPADRGQRTRQPLSSVDRGEAQRREWSGRHRRLSSVAAADTLIGAKVVPPVGSDFILPSWTDALNQALDDYNNGLTGPGHCPN